MKTQLLSALLALPALCRSAVPLVTPTFDPVEGGSLVYAPIAPLSEFFSSSGRLWFKVKIQNDDNVSLKLTSIRVMLTGVDSIIPQNVTIQPGADKAKTVALPGSEIMTVAHPAPASVTIQLTFEENVTPKTVVLPLAPYVAPVPGGKFLYPANEGDLGPDQYFSDLGAAHGPRTFSPYYGQFWGHDWQVFRIDGSGYSKLVPNGNGKVNEDYVGWGVPIRAMADGVVLRTSTGWENNPTAGTRAFQIMAEHNGEAILDVKAKRLSATRAATLVLLASEPFVRVTIWDITDRGRTITERDSASPLVPEAVKTIALEPLSSTQLVTSMRLANDRHRVMLWNISEDGEELTVAPGDDYVDDIAVSELSLTRITGERFASGVRTIPGGNLRLAVFRIGDPSNTIFRDATDIADVATSICTTALSSTRFVSSFRADDGRLKVIAWDNNPSTDLKRRGEATAENISRVAATGNAGGKWVTAMSTNPGGLLRLARWSAVEDGTEDLKLTPELITPTTHAIENTALDITPATGDAGTIHAATASILMGGTFNINGWGNDPDNSPENFEASSQNTAGTVSKVSIDQLGKIDYSDADTEFIVGARTAGGNLKLMTWHWADGGGNSVYLLHGNCRVLYAHFQAGSVDTTILYPGATVKAGQVIGRLGNSGASGAPHTHINSNRVEDGYTPEQLIDAEEANVLSGAALLLTGDRPIPFHDARTLRLLWLQPGGESNAANNFTTMAGHGMFEYSLGIRPGINARYVDHTNARSGPNGRKEWLAGRPETGGPFPTVTQALDVAGAGTRMFIRSGSFTGAHTFDTPMTVRRYDYHSRIEGPEGPEGPVLIGK